MKICNRNRVVNTIFFLIFISYISFFPLNIKKKKCSYFWLVNCVYFHKTSTKSRTWRRIFIIQEMTRSFASCCSCIYMNNMMKNSTHTLRKINKAAYKSFAKSLCHMRSTSKFYIHMRWKSHHYFQHNNILIGANWKLQALDRNTGIRNKKICKMESASFLGGKLLPNKINHFT